MLKFVTSDADSFRHKRKQLQRACEQCRKKKKRCHHLATSPTHQSPASDGSLAALSMQSISDIQTISVEQQASLDHHKPQNDVEAPQLRASSSDSQSDNEEEGNPKRARVTASTVALRDNVSEARRGSDTFGSRFIGDLNPEGVLLAAASPELRGKSSHDSIGIWLAEKLNKRNKDFDTTGSRERSRTNLFCGFSSMVEKVLVPILEEECLSCLPPSFDFEQLASFYFQKIHPIIPVIHRQRFDALHLNDPARILLQQGICLAASMNFSVGNHLRLGTGQALLSHRDFGKQIFAAMRISIEVGLVIDKVVLIQAFALMSFFVDGPEGRDMSSLMIGRAVQYIQSLGIHVQERQRDQDDDDYAGSLLCCVWALDRLNAAFNGRPVLIHDRDIGRDLNQCFDRQEACFQLLLRVLLSLDRIINMYRPKLNAEENIADSEIIPFEDLISASGASQAATPVLATIETLYHAVAMLSHRSKPSETPHRSSAAYLRQSLSASRVTLVVGSDFRDHLILFPFVPYAVSLSLSIAYREMRRNKIPIYRSRARADVQVNCNILEELGEIFWSASIMADIGKSTLKELDRIYSNVANSQQHKKQQEASKRLTSSTVANGGQATAPNPGFSQPPGDDNTIFQHAPSDSVYEQNQDPDQFSFDDIPELDVFEIFDANFDLDGIDAFLEGNLDISFPTNLE